MVFSQEIRTKKRKKWLHILIPWVGLRHFSCLTLNSVPRFAWILCCNQHSTIIVQKHIKLLKECIKVRKWENWGRAGVIRRGVFYQHQRQKLYTQVQVQAWPLLSSVTLGESPDLSRSQCPPCGRYMHLARSLRIKWENGIIYLESPNCWLCKVSGSYVMALGYC